MFYLYFVWLGCTHDDSLSRYRGPAAGRIDIGPQLRIVISRLSTADSVGQWYSTYYLIGQRSAYQKLVLVENVGQLDSYAAHVVLLAVANISSGYSPSEGCTAIDWVNFKTQREFDKEIRNSVDRLKLAQRLGERQLR